MNQHTAFYLPDSADNDWLINELTGGDAFEGILPLSNLKGEIFSNTTLHYFINEELLHDHFAIVAGHNNKLSNASSGEQKKALLLYLLSRKPNYIIVDNVFESLDEETRQTVYSTVQELAPQPLFIQVLNRKNDLLPIIQNVFTISGRSIQHYNDHETFMAGLHLQSDSGFNTNIPPPLYRYEPQNGPLVKLNNVSVQYNGRPVLQDICWEINENEFWQLTGPNGSGKSTLLSMITGNNPKGFGQDLVIFGRRKGSGETVWELKERIGYFSPTMTMHFERQDSIEQMVVSGFFDSVGLYIKPSDLQLQLAREWLSFIGLDKNSAQPFRMLPLGQQRMVLIARAMVKHPPLLILDEPTAGLNEKMTYLFTTLINKISTGSSTTILYVSHRNEAGILPGRIFELMPSDKGSIGRVQDKY
ncbi:MAG: ATP-binding cassette domain-containing protein [Ferruginibacter sp.]